MNYFELLGVPEHMELDLTVLSRHYLELQRRFHPDQFGNASERDRRQSVQQAAMINDAFQTLKHPMSRAEYLLEQRGVELKHEQQSFQDTHFLMQQMELREQLAEIAAAPEQTEALQQQLEQELSQQQQHLRSELSAAIAKQTAEADALAAATLRKLKFFDKLQQELEFIEQQRQD
ncbi:co-chaperone HscB [Alkalimonas collagenimarina]|uniref:Co-chaperone protein HscB homolog n=1 Tax=Alkalimonas collagenimarina TaxID=400390 RepID=A0ABT9H2Z7_9GAMM|nr:co-chaperone HscB [Alkalimonas collagenimarina]MDP4537693.1 co-chaperone HscB [Alkalimonas collagenimarina]